MDTDLMRSVARGLRYRPLEHLIGRFAEIPALDLLEEAIRLALAPDFPDGCHLVGPERKTCEGALVKYGVLDLRFSAPGELLAGEPHTGVPLLRELGFLPGSKVGLGQRVCDDPTCLEMLQDDLSEGRTYLLLFLESGHAGGAGRVTGPDGHVSPRLPEGYLPRPFRVVDACATNASSVWLWKHFYL